MKKLIFSFMLVSSIATHATDYDFKDARAQKRDRDQRERDRSQKNKVKPKQQPVVKK